MNIILAEVSFISLQMASLSCYPVLMTCPYLLLSLKINETAPLSETAWNYKHLQGLSSWYKDCDNWQKRLCWRRQVMHKTSKISNSWHVCLHKKEDTLIAVREIGRAEMRVMSIKGWCFLCQLHELESQEWWWRCGKQRSAIATEVKQGPKRLHCDIRGPGQVRIVVKDQDRLRETIL